MWCAWIVMAACLRADDPQPRPRPAAMVLDLKGKVEVRPVKGAAKTAEIGDLLYPDERLAVPADGAATIVVLGVGAKEVLAPGAEATIGPKGGSPPAAVASRTEPRRSVATTMKGIRAVPDDVRKAGVLARSLAVSRPPTTPISGSTVASDRPSLAWPASDGAKTYRVKLLADGSNREVWRGEVKEPRADFPAATKSLERGNGFHWEVTDQDFRPVAAGEFNVASRTGLEQLEELKPLAASGDRADRFSAVLAYRRLGAIAEALAACERLAKESSDVAAYREVLGDLQRTAGLAQGVK